MVVAPVIIVVQYLRCQFSWDRSIIKRAQLKSIVSCAVSKKQASVLNSETIYFSSSYVIVYRGIILRTWLQLEEWYNIFDANCWYQTRPVCVETGVETMENYTQNGGVILPRGSDRADWGLDFGPHRYFKRKLLEKTPNTSKKRDNVPIHSRTVSHGIVGHTTQTCIPGACILACTILPGEGGGEELLNKVLYVEAPHIPQLMNFLYSRLPVTRTLYSSNLLQIVFYIILPSITRTPDNSNFFLFPLKVRIIGSRLYGIYSVNRPGRLSNFWTLRMGAYSRLGTY